MNKNLIAKILMVPFLIACAALVLFGVYAIVNTPACLIALTVIGTFAIGVRLHD